MATIPIRQLTEGGNDIIPVTHQRAVYDEEGNTLDFVLGGLKAQVGSVSSYAEMASSNAANAEGYANLASQEAATASQKVGAVEALLQSIIESGTTDETVTAQIALLRAEMAAMPSHVALTQEQYDRMEIDGTFSPNTYYSILED